jgi:hypothetical protein
VTTLCAYLILRRVTTPELKIVPKPIPPREHVWTLTKESVRLRADLLSHGEFGWEMQVFRNDAFVYGRRWNLRESAWDDALATRRSLLLEGWRDIEHA